MDMEAVGPSIYSVLRVAGTPDAPICLATYLKVMSTAAALPVRIPAEFTQSYCS